ncbi:DUF6522 family protein [Rhizobium sp. A37_96]
MLESCEVASRFGLSGKDFRQRIRQGLVANAVERGEGDDNGTCRLSVGIGNRVYALPSTTRARCRTKPSRSYVVKRDLRDHGGESRHRTSDPLPSDGPSHPPAPDLLGCLRRHKEPHGDLLHAVRPAWRRRIPIILVHR